MVKIEEKSIILVHSSGAITYREWRGEDISTKHGVIKKQDIKPGKLVKTHLGKEYLILAAGLRDRIQHMRKGARPIYEYDAGIISALLSLERGHTVIEAGTGSACLSLFMGNIVNPGKVYTFERKENFFDVAKENIEKSGLNNIVIENKDILEGTKVKADAIMLDLAEPVKAIDVLKGNLKPGGHIAVFTPILDDIKPVIEKLKQENFFDVKAIQLDLKEINVKKYARVIGLFGFPGFIIIGRKFK